MKQHLSVIQYDVLHLAEYCILLTSSNKLPSFQMGFFPKPESMHFLINNVFITQLSSTFKKNIFTFNPKKVCRFYEDLWRLVSRAKQSHQHSVCNAVHVNNTKSEQTFTMPLISSRLYNIRSSKQHWIRKIFIDI